jgi:hypothetical protein
MSAISKTMPNKEPVAFSSAEQASHDTATHLVQALFERYQKQGNNMKQTKMNYAPSFVPNPKTPTFQDSNAQSQCAEYFKNILPASKPQITEKPQQFNRLFMGTLADFCANYFNLPIH